MSLQQRPLLTAPQTNAGPPAVRLPKDEAFVIGNIDWSGGEGGSDIREERAYEARRIATSRGIGPDEVLLSRRTWEKLRDALYRLEAASEDVAMDLMAGRPTRAEYVEALAHLSAAVRDLQEIAVEPIALGTR